MADPDHHEKNLIRIRTWKKNRIRIRTWKKTEYGSDPREKNLIRIRPSKKPNSHTTSERTDPDPICWPNPDPQPCRGKVDNQLRGTYLSITASAYQSPAPFHLLAPPTPTDRIQIDCQIDRSYFVLMSLFL